MKVPVLLSTPVGRVDSSSNYQQPSHGFNHCSVLEMKVKAQLSVLE